MEGQGTDVRAARRLELRRAVLRLAITVVTVHAVMIGIWYLAGVSKSDDRTRLYFIVAWTVSTALVVAFQMRKVRRARNNILRS